MVEASALVYSFVTMMAMCAGALRMRKQVDTSNSALVMRIDWQVRVEIVGVVSCVLLPCDSAKDDLIDEVLLEILVRENEWVIVRSLSCIVFNQEAFHC